SSARPSLAQVKETSGTTSVTPWSRARLSDCSKIPRLSCAAGKAAKILFPTTASRDIFVESRKAWFKATIVRSRSITTRGVGRLLKTASKSGFAGGVTIKLRGRRMRPSRGFRRQDIIRPEIPENCNLCKPPADADEKTGIKTLAWASARHAEAPGSQVLHCGSRQELRPG